MKKVFFDSLFIKDGYIYQKETCQQTEKIVFTTYIDSCLDGLFVTDLSTADEEHEKNLDVLKQLCSFVEIPVIATGNIKRMEDVKKLLYVGCKQVALLVADKMHADVLEEVRLKFGEDKILVLTADAALDTLVMVDSLEEAVSCIKGDACEGVVLNGLVEQEQELFAAKEVLLREGFSVETLETSVIWADFKKNEDGMVPVVVQDYLTNEVLMVAYMNEESYLQTLRIGKMTYYSRSRQELWLKGDTSGHVQYVKSLTADCDMDTILAKVKQVGVACHTGAYSCFFNQIADTQYEDKNPLRVLENVYDVIADRKENPKEGSYTNYLFDKGVDKILKKMGEEATEIVIAAKNPNPNEIKYEISDYLYHMMVLMVEKDVTWDEIMTELANR
ncbi:MAG: bifunctional phosphoribosyl-AMP cyclohydrolase/phosphoribosyl-ATP diphosphatase HisIE [Lachnospiraceae bacterium]